jgi:membrane protein implicated in regulation of membrane protease activity
MRWLQPDTVIPDLSNPQIRSTKRHKSMLQSIVYIMAKSLYLTGISFAAGTVMAVLIALFFGHFKDEYVVILILGLLVLIPFKKIMEKLEE